MGGKQRTMRNFVRILIKAVRPFLNFILIKVSDCEFVLVEHKDYCSIMSTLGDHIEKDRDGLTGEVRADYLLHTLNQFEECSEQPQETF